MKVIQFARAMGSDALEILDRLQERLEDVLLPLTKQDGVKKASLQNGWDHYGQGYRNVGYWRDAMGVVHLCGSCSGGTTTAGTSLFSLPEDYRPSGRLCFTIYTNHTTARVDVNTSGTVSVQNVNASLLCLDGVTFKAEK